jgi:hypothetical protein
MDIVDEIMALFKSGGEAAYFGEPVTQLEHALQCASLAEQNGAENSLIVAALLHDVGHLLHGRGEILRSEAPTLSMKRWVTHGWRDGSETQSPSPFGFMSRRSATSARRIQSMQSNCLLRHN